MFVARVHECATAIVVLAEQYEKRILLKRVPAIIMLAGQCENRILGKNLTAIVVLVGQWLCF